MKQSKPNKLFMIATVLITGFIMYAIGEDPLPWFVGAVIGLGIVEIIESVWN